MISSVKEGSSPSTPVPTSPSCDYFLSIQSDRPRLRLEREIILEVVGYLRHGVEKDGHFTPTVTNDGETRRLTITVSVV